METMKAMKTSIGTNDRGMVDHMVGAVGGDMLLDRDLGHMVDLMVDVVANMLDNRGGGNGKRSGMGNSNWGSMSIGGNSWGSMSIGGNSWGSMGISGNSWGSNGMSSSIDTS